MWVDPGDKLGTITGVLTYDTNGRYEVLPTARPTVTDSGFTPEVTTLVGTNG